MNQIIKTQIDGVDVEIEVLKMGPATAPEIARVENNIAKEDQKPADSTPQQTQQVKIVKIGNGNPEEIAKVKSALEKSGKDPAALVSDLLNSIESVPEGKDFWQSKVFWINFLAVVGSISAYFGFDFKAHNIDPEMVATIITTIVGALNVYYRSGTDTPLKSVGESVKKLLP